MTATRKSNQIKNLLLLREREKKKRIVKGEGETRISSLSLIEIVGGCGGGGGGYHFDLKERCCCWKIPLFLMT